MCWRFRPEHMTEYSSPNGERSIREATDGYNTNGHGSDASGRKQPSPSGRFLCGSCTFEMELRLIEKRFSEHRLLEDTEGTTNEHATTPTRPESSQWSDMENDIVHESFESPRKVKNENENNAKNSQDVLTLIPSTTYTSISEIGDPGSDNAIVSMRELVAAVNKCKGPEELKYLIDWARQYVDLFCSKSVVVWSKEELSEYGALVDVEPKNHLLKLEFLLNWFNTIVHHITNVRFGQERILEMLERVLYRIDHNVFRGNPDPLIALIRYLIDTRLYKENSGLTEGTHETHKTILHCARYAIIVAGKVEPKSWDPIRDDSLYKILQNKLEKLKRKAIFYPTGFEIQLVAESLKQLTILGFPTGWKLFLRRTQTGMVATAHAIDIVRNAITLSFDPVNLMTCARCISEFVNPVSQKLEDWFVRYQSINAAYLLVLEEPSNYTVFLKTLQTCTQKKRGWINMSGSASRGEKALAYGIVELLTQLAVYSVDDQVRDRSVTELYRMQKEWIKDEDILHQTWQSFGIIAAQETGESSKKALLWLEQCNCLQVAEAALDVIGSQRINRTAKHWCNLLLKSSFVKWMGTRNLQTKLESFKNTMNFEVESTKFFDSVKKPFRTSKENLALSA